jgi:hypothetical protein
MELGVADEAIMPSGTPLFQGHTRHLA